MDASIEPKFSRQWSRHSLYYSTKKSIPYVIGEYNISLMGTAQHGFVFNKHIYIAYIIKNIPMLNSCICYADFDALYSLILKYIDTIYEAYNI